MHQYFVAVDGQQYGPYSLEQLRQQRLPPNALVWREGLAGWLPPSQVPELVANVTVPPPPPRVATPPISVQIRSAVVPQLNLRLVAEKQRALMYSLLGCGCAYFLGFTCIGALLDTPPDGAAQPENASALLALVLRLAIAFGICAVQVWACLGVAYALNFPNPWLWGLGSVFCCIGWIVLLVLNHRATQVLTRAGYKVGLMGANPRQFQ